MTRPLYHSFAWAYDAIVSAPGGPTIEFLARELRSNGAGSGASVIDAGCGTGRYAAGLAEHGFEVTGVDRSAELIEQAESSRGGGIRFFAADLLGWRPAAPADAVVCRGVLNDLTDETQRLEAFCALADMLRDGGVLVADARDWEASRERYGAADPVERRVELENGGVITFRSHTVPDPGGSLLRVRELLVLEADGERTEAPFDFTMRCWSSEELERHARAAGFGSVRVRPAAGEPGGGRSDRLLVTALR